MSTQGGATSAPEDVIDRVEMIIDRIRPSVQADGGDVELVSVTTDGVVKIRLHGACVGCPSSLMTLKMGIERNLRDYVPEVKTVEAID
ncbi:MAG: NifU family protein [Planctomycetota bacterium]